MNRYRILVISEPLITGNSEPIVDIIPFASIPDIKAGLDLASLVDKLLLDGNGLTMHKFLPIIKHNPKYFRLTMPFGIIPPLRRQDQIYL
jgi:hypothetical protein